MISFLTRKLNLIQREILLEFYNTSSRLFDGYINLTLRALLDLLVVVEIVIASLHNIWIHRYNIP